MKICGDDLLFRCGLPLFDLAFLANYVAETGEEIAVYSNNLVHTGAIVEMFVKLFRLEAESAVVGTRLHKRSSIKLVRWKIFIKRPERCVLFLKIFRIRR